jgi:hypothetical protein
MIEYKEDLPPENPEPDDDLNSYFSLEGKHVCLSWCQDTTVATLTLSSGLPHDADDSILHSVMAEMSGDVLRELAGLVRHPRFRALLASIGSSREDWPVRNADFYALPVEQTCEELIREPFYG